MSLTPEEVQAVIWSGLPQAREQGLIIEQGDGGRIRARQPFDAKNIRPGGTISGPTMMGLADAAMYAAILSRLGRVEMAVTQNLNINFLNRPEPADLIADAEIIRLGRRSAVLEVRLYSDGCNNGCENGRSDASNNHAGDTMVAHVTGTYALPTGKEIL